MSSFSLRAYQTEGVEWLVGKKRAILADEPGLGKTLQLLTACKELGGKNLVICGIGVAINTWASEIEKFYPNKTVGIYAGTPLQKQKLLAEWRINQPDYILVSRYFGNLKLLKLLWFSTVIIDEYHLTGIIGANSGKKANRSNKGNKFWTEFLAGLKPSNNLFLVSGTPAPKGVHNLWQALFLINNEKFSSFWKFVNKYVVVDHDTFGHKIITGKVKNQEGFHREVSDDYILSRTKKETLPYLPALQVQYVELAISDASERRLYTDIKKEVVTELPEGSLVITNPLVRTLRLRQCLVHPQGFGILHDETSLIKAIRELLEIEFQANNKVIIFTPFLDAASYFEESLTVYFQKGAGCIKGSVKQADRQIAIDNFVNTPENAPNWIVGTIDSALSYSLPNANLTIFAGFDWSYAKNLQAYNRADRYREKADCKRVMYLYHPNTVEEAVLEANLAKKSIHEVAINIDNL